MYINSGKESKDLFLRFTANVELLLVVCAARTHSYFHMPVFFILSMIADYRLLVLVNTQVFSYSEFLKSFFCSERERSFPCALSQKLFLTDLFMVTADLVEAQRSIFRLEFNRLAFVAHLNSKVKSVAGQLH